MRNLAKCPYEEFGQVFLWGIWPSVPMRNLAKCPYEEFGQNGNAHQYKKVTVTKCAQHCNCQITSTICIEINLQHFHLPLEIGTFLAHVEIDNITREAMKWQKHATWWTWCFRFALLSQNIARGTTDPEYWFHNLSKSLSWNSSNLKVWPPDGATCIDYKVSHPVAVLALVPNFVTKWRHLH